MGGTFEKWLEEQRKAGKAALPRPGQRAVRAGGPTLWDRLRSKE